VRAASLVAASPGAAANPDPVVSAPTGTVAQKAPGARATPAGTVQVAANPTATAAAASTLDQAPVVPPPVPDSGNAHPVISAPANSALEKAAGALGATVDGSTNANRILGRVMGALTNLTGSNAPAVVRTSTPASNPSSVTSSVSAANLPTDVIARA